MLCVANRLMIHGRRTWVRHSRHKECELLTLFFRRTISKSWLDDNRGTLKREGFCRSWHHGFRYKDGRYQGSESRRQFTLKACNALASRGITVFRQAWHAVKKSVTPPASDKTTPAAPTPIKHQDSENIGKNPYEDPEFRVRRGLKPLPDWKVKDP